MGDEHNYQNGPKCRPRPDLAMCSVVSGRASQDKCDGPPLTTATLSPKGIMQNGLPPSINFLVGLHCESLASSGKVRRPVLNTHHITYLLHVTSGMIHFDEPLLERLNASMSWLSLPAVAEAGEVIHERSDAQWVYPDCAPSGQAHDTRNYSPGHDS